MEGLDGVGRWQREVSRNRQLARMGKLPIRHGSRKVLIQLEEAFLDARHAF